MHTHTHKDTVRWEGLRPEEVVPQILGEERRRVVHVLIVLRA